MEKDIILLAKKFIQIEAAAIQEVADQLDQEFCSAVKIINACSGKIVFCGMGKSGHIGYKLASTFSSVGIPSVFLHPAESVHGDLGLLDEKDVLIFISYSGESVELEAPMKYATRKKIPIISITKNRQSTLARHSSVTLTTAISKEACPLNLAPTASTTAALVLGDALGLVCATQKGYNAEKFAEVHPAGQLGFKLISVQDVMFPKEQIPTAHETDTIKTLLTKMTHGPIKGAAAVLDEKGNLIGSVTDGDIRRLFEKNTVDLNLPVSNLMGKKPKTIESSAMVEKALSMIETLKIQFLFVTNEKNAFIGLVHINSILQVKAR